MIRHVSLLGRSGTFTALAVAVAFLLAGCSTSGGTSSSSQPPNIAGTYTGSFTEYGHTGSASMQIQIAQSGSSLSGSTIEGPATYTDTGTMSTDGHFTITETASFGVAYLNGSVAGPGHLSGTWNMGGNALGTWDVQRTAQ